MSRSNAQGGSADIAMNDTSKEEAVDNTTPDSDMLERLEKEYIRDLIQIEKDIYITEHQYIQQSTKSGGKSPNPSTELFLILTSAIQITGNVFKGWDASTQNNRPLAS
jgi:hypothetical protein